MPLQNFWFNVSLNTDIKGFKTSVLRPFLCPALVGDEPCLQTPAPICMAQMTTPPEGGVAVGQASELVRL
jgi:hypothetical protein